MTLAVYQYGSNNGLLEKQTYGNNDYITFTYDDLGRTKTATYSDGRVLTYSYTGDGQLYSTHDSETGYTYLYVYDSLGRLVSSRIKSASGTILRTEQFYNEDNHLTSQNWQMGSTTYTEIYTYNEADGSIATIASPAGQTLDFRYDVLRRLDKVIAGDLYTKTFDYKNLAGNRTTTQVSSLTYSGLPNNPTFGYTYDALGNIVGYSENDTAYTYTYDKLGQLTRAEGNGTTYEYSYDLSGNILSVDVITDEGTTTHTYAYGNAEWSDLLTAYDGHTISYDGSGNPTEYYNGREYDFTWEEGRRLTSATVNGETYTYTYDSNGIRTSKTVNGVTHNYIYASGKLLRETYGNVTLDFLYDNSGYPYALIYKNGTAAAQTYYYITNLQGDVLYLLDSAENVVAAYEYGPYGEVTTTVSSDIAEINPLRYRGYYYDAETDFYYVSSRYYDPASFRFINADCYASTGHGVLGLNMFIYCLNSPINNYDPEGTNTEALSWWSGTMWWLIGADSVLPIGDIIYGAGTLILGAYTISTLQDATPTVSVEAESSSTYKYSEHTKGARKSTLAKHQKGKTRKQRDQGGEKGDVRRIYIGNKRRLRTLLILFVDSQSSEEYYGGESGSGVSMIIAENNTFSTVSTMYICR